MSVIIKPDEHNYGFFSCCSVIMTRIIEYVNKSGKLPEVVDTSVMFRWYKDYQHHNLNITFDYFTHYNQITEDVIQHPIDYHWEHQYNDYTTLEYDKICPIVRKYFTPSNEIKTIIQYIEQKYKIDYTNLSVLFYRGNDKNRETKICGYDEYVDYAKRIMSKNPATIFLIQSDETEFINYFARLYPTNHVVFNDEIRHMNKCGTTVDIVYNQHNFFFSKYYLAITIIMSKAKYIVCGSGNCSIWILFYRENAKNVFQNLKGTWIEG
jgi:hypothetical protein